MAIKLDIEQDVTNTCWRQALGSLNLTADTYTGPAGVAVVGATDSEFRFCPSNSTPTSCVVKAWSSVLTNCMDTCTVHVIRVDITGFSVTSAWARAPTCPAANHQSTCQATIRPPGVSTITYTIRGDALGATIDPQTGVITPGVNQSGVITARASAILLPSCYDEREFLIMARPMDITATLAEKDPVLPVCAHYLHNFRSTGGTLEGTQVNEEVEVKQWPFRQPAGGWIFGGEWTLDALGAMDVEDVIWVPGPGEIFVPKDFEDFPQWGYWFQQFQWSCPMCDREQDTRKNIEAYGAVFFWLLKRDGSYWVQLSTSYHAQGEPFEWRLP